jgi:ADP-ribosylglycohydrolase
MMGAIIGDIVGSVYEWHNIKTKNFPLFRDDCTFTDDTVMTIAVAEGLMNGGQQDDFIDAMKKYGRMYPDAGYGGRFSGWLFSDSRAPYNSFGNGSAMRVSPVGFWVEPSWDATAAACSVHALATRTAEVTHNHPEGIKGAQATADAIMFMRYRRKEQCEPSEAKAALRTFIQEKYDYDLSQTLDEIRPTYRFNATCQETVPQAIIAFLESTDFEDAIRNAISLGGDSDTLAAITGGIAEAAYGIPQWIVDKAWSYLDEPLRDVCRRWCRMRKQENPPEINRWDRSRPPGTTAHRSH